MRSTLSIWIGLALVMVGLAGCEYETLEPEQVIVPETVSFEQDVIPIFNSSCNRQGCHATAGIAPDLTAGNAYISLTFFGYVNTDNPAGSELYKVIETGSMKSFATDQDRAIILKWIEQGAQND